MSAIDKPPANPNAGNSPELGRLLKELDMVIAYLRARNQYWAKSFDEDELDKPFSLLDEVVEINSTPMGVRIQPVRQWDDGLAIQWRRVGQHIRRAIRQFTGSDA